MARLGFFSMNRILSSVLAICVLSSSAPAAPKTIVAIAQQQSMSLAFWYQSSGLGKVIQGRGASPSQKQERQADRDGKVTRLEISPTNVTVGLGERVRFVAIGYDARGNAVGGLKIHWSAPPATSGQRARISRDGEFDPMVPGVFTVTAEAAGRSAQTTVIIRPGIRPNLNHPSTGTRQISSRDLPATGIGSSKQPKNPGGASATNSQAPVKREVAKRSHASKMVRAAPEPMPQGGGGGWNSSNYWSADDPGNRVGDPPGSPQDSGAGSGNFQFSAPIYSSAGRGINISLGLSYNSRVWNKANTQMSYDNDRAWPAPGFNLGFGKLLGMGVYTGCMIVDADGTRHSYTGNITIYNWGTYGVMHTTDGSFIDYTYWTGTNGVIISAQAKLPNGTIINYGAYSQPGGGVFPTSIMDANGNYIYISYVNNSGPRIQAVSDTLGRVINFHYDYNNLLTAVTAPGFNGSTQTLVRLHYRQLALSYGFAWPDIQSTVVRESVPWVIDAIYFPGTGSGYWLYDSYSSYGMLASVIEQRGMSFSGAPLNDMGSMTPGTLTRSEEYSYPLTPNYGLTDAPTYTTLTERWTPDGVSPMSEAVTSYEVYENANPRTTTITLPNLTKNKQYFHNAPGSILDGLVYRDVTFTTDENTPLQSSTSDWQQGAYDSPRPTRVERFDERGQNTAVEFIYGAVYNQVAETRDYDYGGLTLLRSTRTTYQNSANYTNRHIFNLPLSVEVYGSDNVNRVSRTDYQYDGQTLSDTPNVVMHDDHFNPYAPPQLVEDCCSWEWDPQGAYYYCTYWCQYEVPVYDPSTDYRGNVTQITTYADALNLTGPVTETRRYDRTGNLVKASTSCCEQTVFNYSLDTQYSYPQSKIRGSATDTMAQVTVSTTYDFNTGVGVFFRDENGKLVVTDYQPGTLRVTTVTLPTGAQTLYDYDDQLMKVTATTVLSPGDGGTIADQNVKLLNGRGQVRQERARAADEGGQERWDYVDTTYDSMGQVTKQTRPYRYGTSPPNPTLFTYDALGRTSKVVAADYTQPDGSDGSTTLIFYNEPGRPDVAGDAPGETTRVRDAWGRERWSRNDASGHLVEVVEPVFWGNGSASAGMLTTYTYNTLGNLLAINSMNGPQVQQARSFRYDSLGRLTAQKLAEQNATLNDAGVYVGGGTWSDVYTYDERSNLTSRTDARGVKTVYAYNNDPLNRLQSVSWDTTGFGDTANSILPAATVTYQYRSRAVNTPCDPLDPSGLKDVTQMASVSATDTSTESICYDTEGRASSKTLTLASRPDYPFVTDYNYDSLDRVWRVWYPAAYGNGSGSRKVVQQSYDIASRLSSLTFDSQTQASNIVYNAASQTTSLSVGTGTNQVNEGYGYQVQTGLLESQTVTRNGEQLLNLSYDYAGVGDKRTGQITKIYNNLDHTKDRGYEYDALGRLIRATGGQAANVSWAQSYEYDRYGNRTSVTASGYSAKNRSEIRSPQSEIAKVSGPGALTAGSSGIVAPVEPTVVLPTDQVSSSVKLDTLETSSDSGMKSWGNGSRSHHARAGKSTAALETGSTNVALAANGAIATASSSYPGGYGPSGANNGGRKGIGAGDYWNDAAPANTFPDWLQIDFNDSKTIEEIDVFTTQDNYANPSEPTEAMTFSLYGLTGFDVQYWNGSAWVTVPGGSVTGNNKVWKKITFSPITTTKIRVLSNACPDGYSRITELEAWTTAASPPPPRTNVALASNGATATASSSYPGGYDASGANNGGRKGIGAGDYWNDAAPANTFPDWLQVEFNGSKTIGEIDLFTVQDNYANPSEPTEAMTFSLYGLTGFDVQYWNGSSWATVPGGNITGNNKVWKKITFAAIATSKIRVLTNVVPDGYSRITELEAWDAPPPSTNVALAANGGVATASSTYPGYGASGANNGGRKGDSAGDYWNDAAPANTFPDWLQIDFNGSKTIDEIDVFTTQDNYANPSEPTESMTFSLYGLTGFDVQYWNGTAWAAVPGGTVSGNIKVWKKITFAAITTTKIRVLTNASPDGYSRITELEAWSPSAGGGSNPIPPDGHANLSYDIASNRITTTGFTYDAAGNQVRALIPGSTTVSQRFQYDAANRLVTVKTDSGAIVATYTYGTDNQRVMTEEFVQGSSTRTYYVAEGLSVIAEYVEVGGAVDPMWSKSYVYLGNRLLSTVTANGAGGEAVEYHHRDRLGTRIVTNPSTGAWSQQATLPFGTALAAESNGSSTNRRFTSYERSSTTGLDYAVNRHYDSQQGRFTQVDPIEMESVDLASPQTLNLYAYCVNDPVNLIDPSGLGFISWLKKVFRAVAKILKIVTVTLMVAAAVVGTALWLAPADSLIFRAALWSLTRVLMPAADFLSKFGVNVPGSLRALRGTPPWNPSSKPFFGNSFQDLGEEVDGVLVINHSEKGPWWDWSWWLRGGIRVANAIGSFALRQTKALVNYQLRVIRCFEGNRFSAAVSYYTRGSRFNGVATVAAESAELLPSFSVALDGVAIYKKGGRMGIGGPSQRYASGINMMTKRLAGRAVFRTGGGVATAIMAGTFAFTTGYNLSQGVACQLGLQR